MSFGFAKSARALIAGCALLGLALPARAETEEASGELAAEADAEASASAFLAGPGIDPDAPLGDRILDVAVLRPARVAKVAVGFGIFLGSLPMYLVAREVPEAWDYLVGTPFADAFLLPIGRI